MSAIPLSPTDTLIAEFRASKVSFTMMGTKRALDDAKLNTAAAAFGADTDFLGASKKLLNTKDPAFTAVTGIKSRIGRLWHDCTLPYTEPGVRLMRENRLNSFVEQITKYRDELHDAVAALESNYSRLRQEARYKLGELFNESDYPMSLIGLFDVTWEFPNVTPPDYLRGLNPALYEAERARMVGRFNEAVTLAEQAFIEKFQELVSKLAERLTGVNVKNGQPKAFADSTVDNLRVFFDRFNSMSVRSNSQLDELVRQAQDLVGGISASDLKPCGGTTTAAQDVLRSHIANNMNAIDEALSGMIVDKPRRRIVRPKGQSSAA